MTGERSSSVQLLYVLSYIVWCVFMQQVHSLGGTSSSIKTSFTKRMTDGAMHSTYDTLAERLIANAAKVSSEEQYWVCIAGGPGSGKSTLSEAIAQRIGSECVVLPMDGFHFSRAELRAMGESGTGHSYEELLARRGSPWTFDAPKIVDFLSRAKALREAELPTYSRQLSDPVPGGVRLSTHHKIVLVEGNYLLNYDDPSWQPLHSLFIEKWFIECPDLANQRERLIYRHLETWTEEKTRMWGEGLEGAAKKADANDVINAHFISEHKKHADLIITSLSSPS